MWRRAYELAEAAADEVIGRDNRRWVHNSTSYPGIAYELIALRKLENPFFLPLVVPEFDYKQN
jgi:hypothetical protein